MADTVSETSAYVRGQAVGAALVNAALNPLIEWGLNRSKGFQPFWGSGGVVVNIVLTLDHLGRSWWRSSRPAVCTTSWQPDGSLRWESPPALARLPGRAGWLGLLLGVSAAMAAVLVFWVLDAIGVAGMPFWGLLVLKAGYCGVLGGVVAWCTMLRLLGHPRT